MAGPRLTRLASDIGPFVIVPDWILRSGISDRGVRLFAVLARYADRAGEAFPSRRQLTTDLLASAASIDRATKELIDIGALDVQARFDHNGDQTSNLYIVRYAKPAGGSSDPQPPLLTGDEGGPHPSNGGVITSEEGGSAPVMPPLITSGTTPSSPVTNGTRSTLTRSDQDQEQRASARPVHVNTKGHNPRALIKLVHLVLDDIEAGRIHELDKNEELKLRAARARLTYDIDKLGKAERAARARRKKRA